MVDRQAVIIDNGTRTIKSGLDTDTEPNVFATCCGKPFMPGLHTHHNYKCDDKGIYCGNDALELRMFLKRSYPIKYGIITNWSNMESIWQYTFNQQLKVNPEQHNVLLTESVFNDKKNRQKMIQIMFETFNVPAIHIASQPICSMFGVGKQSGIVLESGESGTRSVPIYNGKILQLESIHNGYRSSPILRLNITGFELTYCMSKMCNETLTSNSIANDIACDIKEKLCFVSMNCDKELSRWPNDVAANYELPDGEIITIESERFRCPELLFNTLFRHFFHPIGNRSCYGIHELIYRSAMECNDINIRKHLFSNIVLSGGNTMFNGIEQRLLAEIKKLVPKTMNIDIFSGNDEYLVNGYLRKNYSKFLYEEIVNLTKQYCIEKNKSISCPKRTYLCWIGGAILASSLTTKQWISKEHYEEYGQKISN
eukprot:262455_1